MLARQADALRLPAAYGSDASAIFAWRDLSRLETKALQVKGELLKQRFGGSHPADLSAVWNGEGRNPNAALTIIRQFNSASVVKGLVGDAPKTAWLVGYPLFERIYYLLAVSYTHLDVYKRQGLGSDTQRA